MHDKMNTELRASSEEIDRHVCKHLLIGCMCDFMRRDQLFEVVIQLTRGEFLEWQQHHPNVRVHYGSLAASALFGDDQSRFVKMYWRELLDSHGVGALQGFVLDEETLTGALYMRKLHQGIITLLGSTKRSPVLRIVGPDVTKMIARIMKEGIPECFELESRDVVWTDYVMLIKYGISCIIKRLKQLFWRSE